MTASVLLIDDDLCALNGYNGLLALKNKKVCFATKLLNSCDTAHEVIVNPTNNESFDLAIVDYSFNTISKNGINNGEELSALIRKKMPKTKIVLITSHTDSLKLYHFFKKIQPEGIMIKSEIEPTDFQQNILKVVNGQTFFSPLALQQITVPLFTTGQLDDIDRQIIMLTALGYKIESIANKVLLSEIAIKKRKSKIKEVLQIKKGGDQELLELCRTLNFIPK